MGGNHLIYNTTSFLFSPSLRSVVSQVMSTQIPLPNDFKPSEHLTTSTVDPKQWFSNFMLVVKKFGLLPLLENKDPKENKVQLAVLDLPVDP